MALSSRPKDVSIFNIMESRLTHIDMHDGGVSVETIVNGKPVCESKAVYGTKLKMDNGKEWTTISKMTDCQEPFDVKNGDMITMKVSFDEINHPR
jgi:hypothetical protein